MKSTRRFYDPTLVWLALALTGLGMLFIFDAGYARSLRDLKGTIPREFLMQIPFLLVGFGAAYVLSGIGQVKWKRWSIGLFVISLLAVIAVEIPGIGIEMSGAHRWIGRPPFLIQPAEFFKLAVIVYFAGVFADRKAWPKKLPRYRDLFAKIDALAGPKIRRCVPAILVLIGVALIEREPDLGTAAVIIVTSFAMCILGGVSRTTLLWGVALALVGGVFMVKAQPYRMERILNHAQRWDP